MIKVKKYSNEYLIQLRKKLGMSQTEFWANVNIIQSCGSRYESGRTIPDQVLVLIELIYERKLDLSTPKKRSNLISKESAFENIQ